MLNILRETSAYRLYLLMITLTPYICLGFAENETNGIPTVEDVDKADTYFSDLPHSEITYFDSEIFACVERINASLYENQVLDSSLGRMRNIIELRDKFLDAWDQKIGEDEYASPYSVCMDQKLQALQSAAQDIDSSFALQSSNNFEENDLSAWVYSLPKELPCHPLKSEITSHATETFTLHWYQPLIEEEELPEKHSPCIWHKDRKNTLIVIHGWQGWERGKSRQKLRLFHNAKEDMLASGSWIVSPQGIVDLSFIHVNGSADDDDLGMMLQCMPDADSAIARREEKLVDALRERGPGLCNIQESYNVGILDWSKLAFDRRIKDAEGSIWDQKNDSYISDDELLKFFHHLVEQIPPGSRITLVGHSLGVGIAIRMYEVVAQALKNGDLPENVSRLHKVILADPYFSNFGLLPMDASYWPGRRARKALANAAKSMQEFLQKSSYPYFNQQSASQVNVQIYSTRDDATELFSDNNSELKFESPNVLYSQLEADSVGQSFLPFSPSVMSAFHITSRLISHTVAVNKRRHFYPLYWVFDTLSRKVVPPLDQPNSSAISPASYLLHSVKVIQATRGHGWYRQIDGQKTLQSSDDMFEFQVYRR